MYLFLCNSVQCAREASVRCVAYCGVDKLSNNQSSNSCCNPTVHSFGTSWKTTKTTTCQRTTSRTTRKTRRATIAPPLPVFHFCRCYLACISSFPASADLASSAALAATGAPASSFSSLSLESSAPALARSAAVSCQAHGRSSYHPWCPLLRCACHPSLQYPGCRYCACLVIADFHEPNGLARGAHAPAVAVVSRPTVVAIVSRPTVVAIVTRSGVKDWRDLRRPWLELLPRCFRSLYTEALDMLSGVPRTRNPRLRDGGVHRAPFARPHAVDRPRAAPSFPIHAASFRARAARPESQVERVARRESRPTPSAEASFSNSLAAI